jgi:hypothetical protein
MSFVSIAYKACRRSIWDMADLPLKVKRRDPHTGMVAEESCDTPEAALRTAKQFRDTGFADVWIEDAGGREVDESALKS